MYIPFGPLNPPPSFFVQLPHKSTPPMTEQVAHHTTTLDPPTGLYGKDSSLLVLLSCPNAPAPHYSFKRLTDLQPLII